ncbi:MAG: hypothetical protein OSA51_12975 [Octadecabacter sp.]|nr:hypothetical protein [Octadecabacter sp.]
MFKTLIGLALIVGVQIVLLAASSAHSWDVDTRAGLAATLMNAIFYS